MRDLDRQLGRFRAEQLAGNADDVAQIEKLEQLVRLLANHVQPHVYLQSPTIARQMRKRRLPVRPERHDAPCQAHAGMLGRKLLRRSVGELFGDLLRRVRVIESMRIRRVTQGLNFAQLFAALLKLIERFKFQRDNPFKREDSRRFGESI